jgi:hypothetical protein
MKSGLPLNHPALRWHFEQAREALTRGLALPAITTYLAAIENSIRVTLAQMKHAGHEVNVDSGATLSNALLQAAAEAGMPVEVLAFPEEKAFLATIRLRMPRAELVGVRHNICHGNILSYSNATSSAFAPADLIPLADTVQNLAERWVTELREFRERKQLPDG